MAETITWHHHTAPLAEVASRFGRLTAAQVEDHLCRQGELWLSRSLGAVQSLGRFTWYEAAGRGLRTQRFSLVGQGPVRRLDDELAGLGELLALTCPLSSAKDPIVDLIKHFHCEPNVWEVTSQRRILGIPELRPVEVTNGAISVHLVVGDEDDGSAQEVIVDLASGALRLFDLLDWTSD